MQGCVETLEFIFRHVHVVDARQFVRRVNDGLREAFDAGDGQREMTVGYALFESVPREERVIGEDILVVVLAGPEGSHRRLYVRAASLIEFFADTLEHRGAGVLWAQVTELGLDAGSLLCEAIRPLCLNTEEVVEGTKVAFHAHRSLTVAEEICREAGHQREEVIVEIDILFRQSRDAVNEHFNRRAVESGEIFGRNEVLMQHHLHRRTVYPLWNLALPGYQQKHVPYEWHTFFNASQEIRQCTPITVTLGERFCPDAVSIVCLP